MELRIDQDPPTQQKIDKELLRLKLKRNKAILSYAWAATLAFVALMLGYVYLACVVVIVTLIKFYYFDDNKYSKVYFLEPISLLSPIDIGLDQTYEKKLLNIQKWCEEDSDIAAYQNKVVDLNRPFIKAEYEMLKDWMDSKPSREE